MSTARRQSRPAIPLRKTAQLRRVVASLWQLWPVLLIPVHARENGYRKHEPQQVSDRESEHGGMPHLTTRLESWLTPKTRFAPILQALVLRQVASLRRKGRLKTLVKDATLA